jgi:hypothetical protein
MSTPCSWKTHTSQRQYKGKKKRKGETTFKNLLAMLEVSDNSQRYLNAISSMNSNMKVKGMRLHTWSRLLQTIFLVNVKKSFLLVSSQIMSKERSHTRKGDIRVGRHKGWVSSTLSTSKERLHTWKENYDL